MQKIHILLIDMEYARDELNEPINVDTILDCFDEYVMHHAEFDIWYRTLGDLRDRDPENYDLVLISTKVSAGEKMEEVLLRFSGLPIILGGMLATYAYEEILAMHPDLILSLGECECNLNCLVRLFLRHRNFGPVKEALEASPCSGVAYTDRAGTLQVLPIEAMDLSRITRPLSHRALPQVVERSGLVRIEGSRGCPWNRCSFCSVSWKYGGAPWRAFPLERTVREVVRLSEAGASCVYFTDEDFVGYSRHFLSLFTRIAELMEQGRINPALSVWGSTSVYTLRHFTDEEFSRFIELCRQCNIQVFFLGIESGCNAQLRRFNKGVTREDNLAMLRTLAGHGIMVDAGFILFDAETTLAEIRENITFCRSSGLSHSLSRLSKPLRVIPHTAIYRTYQKKGLLLGELNLSELTRDYRYTDEKVKELYDCLEVIDGRMLQRANALQAELRMSGNYDSEQIASELSRLRQLYFRFIEEFVETFLNAPLNREQIEEMMEAYLDRFS